MEPLVLKNTIIIAKPIDDSAAATVNISKEKISPNKSSKYNEKNKKFKFTDINNISIENKINIKFSRFIKIPNKPIANSQWLIKKLFKITNIVYKANKIKKAIIKANKAIASVKAKPKIAVRVNSCCNDGFLEIPKTKEPNTVPIPVPAPAKPIVAKPAPMNFDDCNNIIYLSKGYFVHSY
jgi:hypothetical protein